MAKTARLGNAWIRTPVLIACPRCKWFWYKEAYGQDVVSHYREKMWHPVGSRGIFADHNHISGRRHVLKVGRMPRSWLTFTRLSYTE